MESMLKSVYESNKCFNKKDLNKVIHAMQIVDRKFFVPSTLELNCYYDSPLPIGKGQTISQPSTVAAMLLYARLEQKMDVLEVGAGSGWNACLIQYLVYPGKVTAAERIFCLAKNAKNNFAKLKKYLEKENPKEIVKFSSLIFKTADALDKNSELWQEEYDRILITAGIPFDTDIGNAVREMADKLLRKKGILICPQESGPLKVYKKNKQLELFETKGEYGFVPLLRGKE